MDWPSIHVATLRSNVVDLYRASLALGDNRPTARFRESIPMEPRDCPLPNVRVDRPRRANASRRSGRTRGSALCVASRFAYHTEGFVRNTQDTSRVLKLTNRLCDHPPDRFALGGRGLGKHDADARRSGWALLNEFLKRGVFEGERLAFDGHLTETRLRKRALQDMLVGKTECSWGARGRWGEL